MNIDVNSIDNRNSQGTAKQDNDFLELLSILLIGGAGMLLSFLGLEANDPWVYALGIVILLTIAGCGVVKFISMVWDLRDRFKKSKDQTKDPD